MCSWSVASAQLAFQATRDRGPLYQPFSPAAAGAKTTAMAVPVLQFELELTMLD
jgi:hypothetical protein